MNQEQGGGTATRMVKLTTGKETPLSMVTVVMLSLEGFFEQGLPGIYALYDLTMLCRDSNYDRKQFWSTSERTLKDRSLIQEDGRIHESVRYIVLAAVKGDGLDMHIENPVTST